MFRIFLFACLVVFMVAPLSHAGARVQTPQPGIQGNQEHTPYYDPRYTPDNLSQNNQRTVQQQPALQADPHQNLELPKTAGEEPFLALIGFLSLVSSAGLR